ncbi:hypothetical protein [Hymenobacter jejuensis]|nr:hypothetical protein [Hymenobacter jejuensis]
MITVNPLPGTHTVMNRNQCAGETATGITFSSPFNGATFNWTSM